jgi:hypothetical protein
MKLGMRTTIAFYAAVTLAALNPADELLEAQSVRRIHYAGPGVTLESQLTPGDRVVVVQKIESPPMIGSRERATASSELRRLRARADAVVFGEIASITSELTADHSWVQTNVVVRAIETFKDSVGAFAVGETNAVIEYDGGEVLLKNVIVRAGTYPLMHVGNRYLFFINKNPDRGHWYSSPTLAVTAEGAEGKVKMPPLWEGVVNSPIDNSALTDAFAVLRAPAR